MQTLTEKQQKLSRLLRESEKVVVAFSGGVDSAFLLKYAFDTLGRDNVLAAIGDSPTLARDELSSALEFVDKYGLNGVVVETGEMAREEFLANPRNRCFHCKNDLFEKLTRLAADRGFALVLDGTNADDLAGHRPGRKAAVAHGVKSPLAEAGLTKPEIRSLSRRMGLSTWNKPAMACLASRFPYGQRITRHALARIEQAEHLIRRSGFENVRVRDHDCLARIEVDRERITDLLAAGISQALKDLGFTYVTVDLEGFRSGSLNNARPRSGREETVSDR